MKPLQHALISAKTYGGNWKDYIEIHNFLDSSKATCAHFKHRFLLHHAEGIELGVRIFGETFVNGENRKVPVRQLLTDHLVEDLGKVATIDDWARDLVPDRSSKFYQFLAKKRDQIENNAVKGETELLEAFGLSAEDRAAIRDFLSFPLLNSAHPAALLISHNSFAVFLAEKIFGYSFFKENTRSQQLVSVREVLERLIFLRFKAIYSLAEIIARTSTADWMQGPRKLTGEQKKAVSKIRDVQ